jgi:ribose 5-phosphate isomerase B
MKIYLATDHAGFELKEKVAAYLASSYPDAEVEDCGAYDYDEHDDYPTFIKQAKSALSYDIQNGLDSRAIVFGGSGEGEAITMNREPGVRCTTYYGGTLDIVRLGREHNDANAISFGYRFVEDDECFRAVDIFLTTEFEGGRHISRIQEIDN